MKIAIIGTAGRGRQAMTRELWDWMVDSAKYKVPEGSHVVSGGAAWADHLAVELMLIGHAGQLTLHLPAPFEKCFIGPHGSAGSVANFYHGHFSQVIRRRSLSDIEKVLGMAGVTMTHEPVSRDTSAMFNRNEKVARCEKLLAYTFGRCGVPADGGTKNTWNKCRGIRTHIELPIFEEMR